MTDFATIYSTLSQVDLSQYTEKKMGLTYLSWANAWDVLMKHYPSATFGIMDSVTFDDGTMEVWVIVTVEKHQRIMWLPVMDNRNNAIPQPSARAISDARMRCLVKCLSLFGLGLYIYQGEDLPRKESKPVDMESIKESAMGVLAYIHGEYTEEEQFSGIKEIFSELSDEEKSAIWLAKTKGGFFTQEEKAFIRQAASS